MSLRGSRRHARLQSADGTGKKTEGFIPPHYLWLEADATDGFAIFAVISDWTMPSRNDLQKICDGIQRSIDTYSDEYIAVFNECAIKEFQQKQIRRFFEAHVDHNGSAGFVYLFESSGHYKIGLTSNVKSRLSGLQVSTPHQVALIHSVSTSNMQLLEKFWHKRFEALRVNGEWFCLSNEDVAEFCAQEEI